MASDDQIKFSGDERDGTEKARLIFVNQLGEEIWLPESQLLQFPGGKFSIPKWLAEKHDIEED